MFGLLGVLNLAHGELVMIGAYCAYVVQAQRLAVHRRGAARARGLRRLGFVVERWLVRPLYQRPFDTLVVTWGLSLLIRKCAEAMFGLGYKSLNEPIGGTLEVLGATYPRYRLVLIVVSVVVLGALVWLVRPQPHRHAHPGDGRQPRSRARARHPGQRASRRPPSSPAPAWPAWPA